MSVVTEALTAMARASTAVFAVSDGPAPVFDDAYLSAVGIANLPESRTYCVATLASRPYAEQIRKKRLLGHSANRPTWLGQRVAGLLERRSEWLFVCGAFYIRANSGVWTSRSKSSGQRRHHNDPLWLLDALPGANEDVEPVGHDELRGASTACYRLTVDLARVPDIGRPNAGSLRRSLRRWDRALPVELWLDDEDRIRRMSFAPHPPRGGLQLWRTTEIWGFGSEYGENLETISTVLAEFGWWTPTASRVT